MVHNYYGLIKELDSLSAKARRVEIKHMQHA